MIDLQQLAYAHRPFTVSLAAWLMAYFDREEQWSAEMRTSLQPAVDHACVEFHRQQRTTLSATQSAPSRRDPRANEIYTIQEQQQRQQSESGRKVRVFTDYSVLLHEVTLLSDRIELVDNLDSADFYFTANQIKDFLKLPLTLRVCQFPYESALIRKDLLPLTVRQHCYRFDEKSQSVIAPDWWLPCFDLSTEFHLFAEEFRRRCALRDTTATVPGAEVQSSTGNRWILKPAEGTRGFGHRIVEDQSIDGLHFAAVLSPCIHKDVLCKVAGVSTTQALSTIIGAEVVDFDGADRVAQLLVDNPVLMRNRKFDMRCFVFVRSFEPFEAYYYDFSFARLAFNEYSNDALHDPTVSITVCCYNEDERIASGQERVLHRDMQSELDEQYGSGAIQWSRMRQDTIGMMRELFSGAAKGIGQWPNSSAYYSIDVIYEQQAMSAAKSQKEEEATESAEKWHAQPKLVEVNFMGDWHGPQAAMAHAPQSTAEEESFDRWATDLLTCLCLPQEPLPESKFVRL